VASSLRPSSTRGSARRPNGAAAPLPAYAVAMAKRPRTPSSSAADPARPTIAILGPGQMGLVCAAILTDPTRTEPTPEVILWGHSDEETSALAQTRTSRRLPGLRLADSVRVTHDDRLLESADLIVSAIPVQFTREAWTRLRPHIPPQAG